MEATTEVFSAKPEVYSAKTEVYSGSFTDSQLAEYKEAFSYFDKNGDGYITVKDLPALMTFLGHEQSEEELQECLAECNVPGDGIIQFSQFRKILVMQKKHVSDPEMELRDALHNFARRGLSQTNGKISIEELRFAMTNLGNKLQFGEVDSFIRELEVDDFGYTGAEEIIKVISDRS